MKTKNLKCDRPPLTLKSKKAITAFVKLKTMDTPYTQSIIEYTLVADRWPRESLYDWLSKHGHVWDSKLKTWRLKQ